ncbi:MAG: LacI family transcriptional regulator [Desulfovibrio sp.]|jgi:LacI family transcriptional regulator|nr:LacI family transcriptional regulator [Desulfovibrio sp.]
MPARPSTIKDIAGRIGVSPSTVSRALNADSRISDNTRKRVRSAAEELGYIPNLSARHIRRGHSWTVGLLVPDIRNSFYNSVAACLAERCRNLSINVSLPTPEVTAPLPSFQLVLGNTDDDPQEEAGQVLALIEARAAGLVITPSPAPLEKTIALLRSLPVVQLHRHVPAIAGDVICMDEAAGVRAAATHLLAAGHRRIAYSGTRRDISTGAARLQGFLEAHEAAGVVPDWSMIQLRPPRAEFGAESAHQALTARPRPTAILFGSTELTAGGLQAIAEIGFSIPADISVIGYGDSVWSELLSPPLSTISLPSDVMAQRAAQRIFYRIENTCTDGSQTLDGNRQGTAEHISLPPRLILRCSTMPI